MFCQTLSYFFANLDDKVYGEISELAESLIDDFSLRINHKEEAYNIPVFGRFSVESLINYLGLDMSDVESEARYISPLDSFIVNEDYNKMNLLQKSITR